MGLDQNNLESAIYGAFATPDSPEWLDKELEARGLKADDLPELDQDERDDIIKVAKEAVQKQLAADLAACILTFVQSGRVVGISTTAQIHVVTHGDQTSQEGETTCTGVQVGAGWIE